MVKYQNGDILRSWTDSVSAPRPETSSEAQGQTQSAAEPAAEPAALTAPDPHPEAPCGIPPKTLRATITVDMEAGDYIEAAEHQALLQKVLAQIRQDYPGAWLTLGGRHKRGDAQAGRRPRLLRPSGRLNAYE
jgi:hypothetical protein